MAEGKIVADQDKNPDFRNPNVLSIDPDSYAKGGSISLDNGGTIPDFIPDVKTSASQNIASSTVPDFISEKDQPTSFGEKIATGVESAARVGTLGLSDLVLNKVNEFANEHSDILANFGVTPENISPSKETLLKHREQNPLSTIPGSMIGAIAPTQVLGGAAAGLAGTELAGGLTGAIQGVTGLGATLGQRALVHGVTGGIEGAMLSAGNLISDASLGDSSLNAQKVGAHLGFGTLLGMGLGATLGTTIGEFINKNGVPKGSFAEGIQDEIDSINKKALNEFPEITMETPPSTVINPEMVRITDKWDLPLLEGIAIPRNTVKGRLIRWGEDALINGAPTYAGISRSQQYRNAFDEMLGIISDVIPDTGDASMSKRQLGDALINSHVNQIEDEFAPTDKLYDEYYDLIKNIPTQDNRLRGTAAAIKKLAKDYLPDSDEGRLLNGWAEKVKTLSSIPQIRNAIKTIRTTTADKSMAIRSLGSRLQYFLKTSETNHVDSYIQKNLDMLGKMTDPGQIEYFAPIATRLANALNIRQRADAAYAPIRKNLSNLLNQLGKKTTGSDDAIDFLKNKITPENIVNKLFNENDSEFMQWYSKTYPENMELARNYFKQTLRDSATKDNLFSPQRLFTELQKRKIKTPESLREIFKPDEIEALDDMHKYLSEFPANYNPSGTEHLSAFKEFFKSPTGALISNTRDAAIYAYIKAMSNLPKDDQVMLGTELANKLNPTLAIKSIIDKNDSNINQSINAMFVGGALPIHKSMSEPDLSYDESKAKIEQLANTPNEIENHISQSIGTASNYLPNISAAMGANLTRAVQFLNSKIPKPIGKFPASDDWEPSTAQKDTFIQYVNMASNPLTILAKIKDGTIMRKDIETVMTCYPDLYKDLQSRLTEAVSTEAAKHIPHYIKEGLSLFINSPIDESQYRPVVIYNQMAYAANQSQKQNEQKSTLTGLKELKSSKRSKTQLQNSEQD